MLLTRVTTTKPNNRAPSEFHFSINSTEIYKAIFTDFALYIFVYVGDIFENGNWPD